MKCHSLKLLRIINENISTANNLYMTPFKLR